MITESGNSGVSIMRSRQWDISFVLLVNYVFNGGVGDSLSLWETWIIASPTVSSLFCAMAEKGHNTNVAVVSVLW